MTHHLSHYPQQATSQGRATLVALTISRFKGERKWRRNSLGSRSWLATTIFATSAVAQDRNELTGIIGRTFISDQGVRGATGADTVLHSGNGLTFEVNYGRRIWSSPLAALTFEVPFALNPDEDLHFKQNVIPVGYRSYFITPSIRANLFPSNGLSPWISFGAGFGHFSEKSELEFGGVNPGKTGTSTGVFQMGVGIDLRIFNYLA